MNVDRGAEGVSDVVLVGSGWAHHAADGLRGDPHARISALVARGSARSHALASRLGVPLFCSVDELPTPVASRAAVVAVDERTNPSIVRSLLERDYDVLCAHPVAPTADGVRDLFHLAERRRCIVGTDYTLVLARPALIARAAIVDVGPLIRVVIEHPGRLLPMALHLALCFAGPITRVCASRVLPDSLREPARRTPGAFPPSLMLEHASGVVSSLVGVPHAATSSAFRCTLSGVRARVDVALPSGGVSIVRADPRRGAREESLLDGTEAPEPFGALMQTMVRDFLAAAQSRSAPPCSLLDEVQVRAVWNAIPTSLRHRAWALAEASA